MKSSASAVMCNKTITDLTTGFKCGSTDPVIHIEETLSRARLAQAHYNCFSVLDESSARMQAVASSDRWRRMQPLGALDGVPVTIKDGMNVKGLAATLGSSLVHSDAASSDAVVVSRLREAGAIILGLTTTPEFYWKGVTDSVLHGITRNPLDPTLTPGGSSGGAAAAVAAGVSPMSVGSDAGGSIRIPAAFCGLVGFKPTFNHIPLANPAPQMLDLPHYGPLSLNCRDAAISYAIMAGHTPARATEIAMGSGRSLKNLRVGRLVAPEVHVDPQIDATVEKALALLIKHGATLTDTVFDVTALSSVGAMLYRLGVGRTVSKKPEPYCDDTGLLQYLEIFRSFDAAMLYDLLEQRSVSTLAFLQHMTKVDILIGPVTPLLPFAAGRNTPDEAHGDWFSWNPYTPAFNAAGAPALSIPFELPDGLSAGVQIVAKPGDDYSLLGIGRALELAGQSE